MNRTYTFLTFFHMNLDSLLINLKNDVRSSHHMSYLEWNTDYTILFGDYDNLMFITTIYINNFKNNTVSVSNILLIFLDYWLK